MSVEQLAIDTKIPRASIDALEEDRFTALPGPVFVKGFFRCCARSLSLDAEVVMALLHEHERAQQQLKSGGRRERNAPQLLGRTFDRNAERSTDRNADRNMDRSIDRHADRYADRSAGMAPQYTSVTVPRSPLPAAPVHAVPGETALATTGAVGAGPSGARPIGPLFDFRAVAPLLAGLGRTLGLDGSGMSRVAAVVRGASNSRLLMWIAVSLMIALIVVTAFVMAGGIAPNLPQS